MGLERGWECNLLNVNLCKNEGQEWGWGRCSLGTDWGKRIWCIMSIRILGMGTTTIAWWKANVGTSAAEDLMANQEGWIKIHFQKASHWYFLFASFSSGLCLYSVLCRTWGHEPTGWNRLNLASLSFYFTFFLPDYSIFHYSIWYGILSILSLLPEPADIFPLIPLSVYQQFLSPRLKAELVAFNSCLKYRFICFFILALSFIHSYIHLFLHQCIVKHLFCAV